MHLPTLPSHRNGRFGSLRQSASDLALWTGYFQAVMVDLDLPDAKGLEALHALVGAAPYLPILVLGDDTVLPTQSKNLSLSGALMEDRCTLVLRRIRAL